jgi:hypothetical protein
LLVVRVTLSVRLAVLRLRRRGGGFEPPETLPIAAAPADALCLLDGRGVNGRFWFFYGALSDVEYQITVTDTVTGAARTYQNQSGNLCGGADIEAL